MPSNVTSSDGLWSTARELSLRKQRKSRGAPMKERLNNCSDSEETQSPKEELTVTKKTFSSQLSRNISQTENVQSLSVVPESAPTSPVATTPKTKTTLFSRIRKVPMNGEPAAIDVFHFEGEGLQYRGKLIGIKDVEGPRGDEMCQAAMQEIVAALKQSKEHKARITISVSLHGLKLKDEKGTTVLHEHAVPKISYIWRDQSDQRAFGYVYGTPETGHKMIGIKIADKSADALVGSIHQLFQVAFRLKQHELELAKKGQDDAVSNDSGGSDGSSKQENGQPAMRMEAQHETRRTGNKVDEANLLDLESELFSLSQGLEQMNHMQAHVPPSTGQDSWADFGGSLGSSNGSSGIGSDQMSSASSTSSSSSDALGGRGSTPQSIRTITPDPFDTMVQYQTPPPAMAIPRPVPGQIQGPPGWGGSPPLLIAPPGAKSMPQMHGMPMFVPQVPVMGSVGMMGGGFVPVTTAPSVHDGAFGAGGNPFGQAFAQETQNVFGVATDMFGHNSLLEGPSVFDPPPPPLLVPKEEKPAYDPFALNAFGDLGVNLGGHRSEKPSKWSFPQPVIPKLGELKGEPATLRPATTTIDRNLLQQTVMAVGSGSPPQGTSLIVFAAPSSSAQLNGMPIRRISSTANSFQPGMVAAPVLPPRPLAHSSSVGGFSAMLPPHPAPRRSTTQAPIPGVAGFAPSVGLAVMNPFVMSPTVITGNADPFDDVFFSLK